MTHERDQEGGFEPLTEKAARRREDRELLDKLALLTDDIEEVERQQAYLQAVRDDHEKAAEALVESLVDRLLPPDMVLDIVVAGGRRLLVSRKNHRKEIRFL